MTTGAASASTASAEAVLGERRSSAPGCGGFREGD